VAAEMMVYDVGYADFDGYEPPTVATTVAYSDGVSAYGGGDDGGAGRSRWVDNDDPLSSHGDVTDGRSGSALKIRVSNKQIVG